MITAAVPYVRTSTDDRGQDPIRQMSIIGPWAEREGVALLEPEVDEGTSASTTGPLDRSAFIRACERARAAGATAIVVEAPDRFTRQGSELDSWARVEVRLRYGLEVLGADKPLALHGTMAGNVTNTVSADGAKAWTEAHKSKVRSGMARKKAAGARFGRPPKDLSAEELALVAKLRAEGKGWRRCAHEVSEGRGAFRIADPKRSKQLRVSHSHVRRQSEKAEQK